MCSGGHEAKRRVLVVDDRPLVLRAVQAMLAEGGYEVVAADCVAQALARVEQAPSLDAAVLDVELPDGVGFDIVDALPPRCGVVMMTGNRSPDVAAHAARIGVREFLHKPFPVQTLIEAVAREIERAP